MIVAAENDVVSPIFSELPGICLLLLFEKYFILKIFQLNKRFQDSVSFTMIQDDGD